MTSLDDFLAARAISPETAEKYGVRYVENLEDLPEGSPEHWRRLLPGVLFPWTSTRGHVEWQLKPDNPDRNGSGDPVKYVFRPKSTGYETTLWTTTKGRKGVVLVEGTGQTLAVSEALSGYTVIGLAGCYGWLKDRVAHPDLAVVRGQDVVVLYDADLRTNPNVWEAATGLKEALEVYGARSVRWGRIPGKDQTGVDDWLAVQHPEDRRDALQGLLEAATEESFNQRSAPKRSKEDARHDDDKLRPLDLYEDMMSEGGMSLARDDSVSIYSRGVWSTNKHSLISKLTEYRGNAYKSSDYATMRDFIVGSLARNNHRLPEFTQRHLIGVTNGVLDIETLELIPEDPSHYLAYRVPVAWNPTAEAPVFEQWSREVLYPGLAPVFYQMAGQCFDSSMNPEHAGLLHGGSNSGKSTMLGVVQDLVGPELTVAENMKSLSEGQFSLARLYGKIMVVAGELSAEHLSDASQFKLLLGRDTIPANKKYGGQFDFTNRATPMFSCNEIPTVSETSRAYLNRVKYFYFPNTYENDQQDLTIPARLRKEREGIFRLFIEAHRRRLLNGGKWDPTPPGVQEHFEKATNRVAEFVIEQCTISPAETLVIPDEEVTSLSELHKAFLRTQEDRSQGSMGLARFKANLESIKGVRKVRTVAGRKRGYNVVMAKVADRVAEEWQPQNEEKPSATRENTDPVAIVATFSEKVLSSNTHTTNENAISNMKTSEKVATIARNEEFPQVKQGFSGGNVSATTPPHPTGFLNPNIQSLVDRYCAPYTDFVCSICEASDSGTAMGVFRVCRRCNPHLVSDSVSPPPF